MQDTLAVVLAGGMGSRLSPSPMTELSQRYRLAVNTGSSILPSLTVFTPAYAEFWC